jgi:hypothetical protein
MIPPTDESDCAFRLTPPTLRCPFSSSYSALIQDTDFGFVCRSPSIEALREFDAEPHVFPTRNGLTAARHAQCA